MTAKPKTPTGTPTKTSIGHRLRAAREAAGLTQTEAAERLGTLQGAIAQYERGDRAPGAILLWRWAQALGVSLDSLLLGVPGVPRRIQARIVAHLFERALSGGDGGRERAIALRLNKTGRG